MLPDDLNLHLDEAVHDISPRSPVNLVSEPAPTKGRQQLKILMLEDDPNDAELIQRELREAGFDFAAERVDTWANFIEMLDAFAPDVVLLDCNLPEFSGADALAHERRVHPEIPVVIVTGTIGDEAAIDLLKAGAKDYVLKSNLVRLPSAMNRVISVEQGIRARKTAEAALRESEAKFRSLVEQNIVGIAIVRDDGTIAYANPYFARLIGYAPPELVGRALLDFVPDDAKQGVIERLGAQLSNDDSFVQHQSALNARDGRRIEVLVNAALSTFEGCPASIAVVIDITQHKRAEEALRVSEARYRDLFNSTRDGITVFDPSCGRSIAANPAAVRLFGAKDEAEFLSRKPWENSPERQPDGRASEQIAREILETVMRTGSLLFEWTHRRFDGAEFPADVLLTRVTHGAETLIYSSVRDVTERKRTENDIREAGAKFRSLVEQNVAGIFIIREDGTIGYVNPCLRPHPRRWNIGPDRASAARFHPRRQKADVREQLAGHLGAQLTGDGDFLRRESPCGRWMAARSRFL